MEDELKRNIQNAIATSLTLVTGEYAGDGKLIASVGGYDVAAEKVMELVLEWSNKRTKEAVLGDWIDENEHFIKRWSGTPPSQPYRLDCQHRISELSQTQTKATKEEREK